MLRLLVLCALAAYVSADGGCCTLEDRKEVLSLWESVWSAEYTGRRVAIAQAVFARLFELAPGTKDLFANVKANEPESPEFRAHCIRVVNGLDTVFNLAFDDDALNKQLDHLGAQHAKIQGMQADYFGKMRQAFADVLPQVVPCFNSAAWDRCLHDAQDRIASAL
eukprot:TRINITY_DN49195_c0_g1_i1.p1 TRINITY_DN49195_c0_g1~~TRINITY_DN49195_c0_g1_i1.p1  ORF type:complete len:165 (+),score=12.52 TRINITY_DN49195_c0_g1_i1:40-534(+)